VRFANQAAKLRETELCNLRKGYGGSTVNLMFAFRNYRNIYYRI